ncbi:MAG: efflux RND transporter periplasmic adaptor subunit [Betaproteobacteria bacterium]|jgi:RND family efflux transporter MFP subunit|nr:MAG: efflux RND transporter periplasmic adaptor subunit [Betaproteobacteria bacterium]
MRTLFFIFWLLSATAVQAQSPQVTTRSLGEVAVYPQREAFATVISLNDSRIAAEVTARIVEIPVEVGQVVKQGATLARLDSRDYALGAERAAATLESARSAKKLAQQRLARARKLVDDGFISPEALDLRESDARTAAAQLRAAEADLATARRNIRKCLVRAPFKAIIKERLGQVGEIATPGAPLVRVLDASRIEVSARVQPDYVAALKESERITFETRTESFELKLHRIVPALNQRERNQEARFRFSGENAMPGTAGRVVWQSVQAHLPPDLVLRRGDELGVFIANGNEALFVPLPLAQEGRPAPVTLPLSATIIVGGRYQLQDGDAISPVRQN